MCIYSLFTYQKKFCKFVMDDGSYYSPLVHTTCLTSKSYYKVVHPGSDAAVYDERADSGRIAERIARDEALRRIEASLQALRPAYRDVIRLRDYENRPWNEIAALLGCPSADAARMRYARAITELAAAVRRSGQTGKEELV